MDKINFLLTMKLLKKLKFLLYLFFMSFMLFMVNSNPVYHVYLITFSS
ncbi:hypothetical protein SMSP2_02370 [Limihaloglobus sulfuriphilus]|uniref:Uncharacterized protein n=1 Tax=Limihaloglobus sulfuriphilus TaxID=1851148 RepID=A0A1Q2MH24_9BACT|nr:hypothetical protein SMSP2_02370 [Limihaloglobus sulfuriphilus]